MTIDIQAHSDLQRVCRDDDVARLVRLARPSADGLALALATDFEDLRVLASHAGQMIAINPAQEAARAIELELPNVTSANCLAEALPWHDGTFDLVCCVDIANRFSEVDRFLEEAARVLKPGGSFVVYERLLPEDDRPARYVDAFYQLGDPHHHQAFAEYRWHGLCLNAGLEVRYSDICHQRTRLLAWAEAHSCTGEVIERLQILLAQVPHAVSDFLRPSCAKTPDAEFDQHFIALVGSKR